MMIYSRSYDQPSQEVTSILPGALDHRLTLSGLRFKLDPDNFFQLFIPMLFIEHVSLILLLFFS